MRILHALLAATMATMLTACGSALTGTPLPGETDIRALDTGSYPTEPLNAHDDDPVPPFYEMYEVAALRLADYVISPGVISSELIYGTSAGTAWGSVMPSWLGKGADGIVDKHKVLYGFEAGGASVDKTINLFTWPSKDPGAKFTGNTIVLQFPDSERADAAAQELYDADFGLQEGRTQPVALPAHPSAHAHWRPDSPFLRTFMPHGPYVIAFLLSVPTPDRPALTILAESAYTKQIDALSKTTPLTAEEVMTLPGDTDHLLMPHARSKPRPADQTGQRRYRLPAHRQTRRPPLRRPVANSFDRFNTPEDSYILAVRSDAKAGGGLLGLPFQITGSRAKVIPVDNPIAVTAIRSWTSSSEQTLLSRLVPVLQTQVK